MSLLWFLNMAQYSRFSVSVQFSSRSHYIPNETHMEKWKMYTLRSALYPSLPCMYLGDQGRVSSKEHKSHCRILTYPWGLRSRESSLLCCKLGDPRSAEALVAAVAVPLLTDGVDPKDPDPFAQAFGGLVNNDSDSARCLTWCITPSRNKVRVCVTQDHLPPLQEP